MADEIEGGVDLLGDPWTPARDPRGRKRHKRNALVAEKIAVLKATGSKLEEIAQRIGLSEPTLRKYYLRELEGAPSLARQVLTEAMWAKALAGNVSAARFIREEFPKGDAEAFMQKVRNPVAAPAARLGKKEAADLAAETAGQDTGWGDDLNPPIVN